MKPKQPGPQQRHGYSIKVSIAVVLCAASLCGFVGTEVLAQGNQYAAAIPSSMLGTVAGDTNASRNARTQAYLNKKVSVSLEAVTVEQALKTVASKAGLKLSYKWEPMLAENRVTVDVTDANLVDVLHQVTSGLPLQLKLTSNGQLIVVSEEVIEPVEEEIPEVIALPAHQVSGTVRSAEDGHPLPGVNVAVKGTMIGTATDVDGRYSLEAPNPTDTLVFSFVGYITQEIAINGQSTINVELREEVAGLEEVIVVGYSTQQRGDISGSVAIIDIDRATIGSSQQLDKQLQGRAPGVTVVSSGQPGEQPTVRIRGLSTFGNNDPLYIVDGVPTQNVNNLSPSDIESMQVLKDAAAASIYGSRASNGVIVVTTKRGRGRVQVQYNATAGYELPRTGNVWNVLTPLEMAKLKWMAIENSGGNPRPDPLYGDGPEPRLPDYILPQGAMEGEVDESEYFLVPEYTGGAAQLATFNQITRANKEGTNWYSEIVRPAFSTNHSLSASGGGEQGNYFLSFNYLQQEGTVIETDHNRYTFRVNTLFNAARNFRIGENFTFASTERSNISSDQTSAIGQSFTQQPIIPVYDIAGNFAGPKGIGSGYNPVAVQKRSRNDRTRDNRMFGSAFAELDLLGSITLRTSLGTDIASRESRDFNYPEYERAENITQSSFQTSSNFSYNWTWTNTAIYNGEFGNHDLDLLIGSEAFKSTGTSLGGSAVGYFSFDPNYVNLNTGEGDRSNFSSDFENALLSFFGRLDYNYNSKYILSATLRRDGSSRFTGKYRWGMFPAFSAGWRVSQEPFMRGVTWLDDLRIRGSYGVVGNQLNVSSDNPYTLFVGNLANSYYAIDGSNSGVQLGFRQGRIGNPDARWERNINGNIGFDAMLFGGRVEAMAEYYWKDVDDLLYNVTLPGTMGMASVPAINVGHIKNRGVDASLGYNGSLGTDLQYDATLTFSAYRNKIVKIADGIDFFGGSQNRNEVGHPMNSFYGYRVAGFWQSQEEIDEANASAGGTYQPDAGVGRWRFVDVNGDGVITPDDRDFLGDPHPDFTYGLDLGLNYKNLDFNVFLYGSQGHDIWAFWTKFLDFYPFLEGAKSKDALYNSWRPDNRNAKLPIQENVASDATSNADTDYYVRDGSYLRVKEVVIGYTLPRNMLQRVGANRLRIYAQISNPFTFTGYNGLDPEVYGTDTATYAHYRQFQLGIDLSF